MAQFSLAFEKVLKWEGGEVNDPRDPGGHTRYGISKRAYPEENINSLTLARARQLYRRDYWGKVMGDEIGSQQIAEMLFDFAVNAGVVRATKMIQRLVGAEEDGVFGPRTLVAVNAGLPLVRVFTLARVEYYTRLVENRPSLRSFHYGWVRRALSYL